MKKKIVGIFVFILFLIATLSSTEASDLNDDVDINIYAGMFGLDIGRGVTADVVNNKNESVTVFINFSFDFLFLDFRGNNISQNITIQEWCKCHFGFRYGISLFSITIEGGSTTVTRDGIIINNFVILFK